MLLGLMAAPLRAQQGLTYGTTPALPRVYINTRPSAMPSNGIVHHLHAGASLQDTINAASPGDVIAIDPGLVMSGVYTLPHKVGADSLHWITMETAGCSATEGVRVDTTQNLAKIHDNTRFGEDGVTADSSASYYRLTCLAFNDTTVDADSALYHQINLLPTTHHIYLDHVYLIGVDSAQCITDGVLFGGAWEAVTDSYIRNIHDGPPNTGCHGHQVQTIAGYTGAGPYKIVNNYLESSGENILFGGGDQTTVLGQNPADIEVRRNHVIKPLAWGYVGGVLQHNVDNLFECKNCQRVLIEANIFENMWAGEQNTAILWQTASQYGLQPWTQISDVTFRWNHVTNAPAAVAISGHVRDYPSLGVVVPVNNATSRILIENNVFDKVGVDPFGQTSGDGPLVAISNGAIDITIRHNTIVGTDSTVISALTESGGAVPNGGLILGLDVENNVYDVGYYGIFCAGGGSGSTALNNCNSTVTTVPGLAWKMTGNLFYYWPANPPNGSWGSVAQWPAGNQFSPLASVGFANFAGGNYLLMTNWRSITTDGSQPGANIALLNAMLNGVQ